MKKIDKLNIIFTEDEIKKLNLKKERYYYIIKMKTSSRLKNTKKLH